MIYCAKTKRSGETQLIKINTVSNTLDATIPKIDAVERNLKKEDIRRSSKLK
jgi:hypothetical protein